jgi:hypothetical protein
MTAHINAGHPNRVIRMNKRDEPDSISPCGRTTNMGDTADAASTAPLSPGVTTLMLS